MKGRTWALLFLVLTVGCAPDTPATMDRDAFIDVMIELRKAERESGDETTFAERRDEILGSAQVTDSMLLAFARIRGRDPGFMAAVWDSIDRVVNEIGVDEEELGPDMTGPR